MADEPKWEPIEAPPWAKQPAEPKWEPIEAPAWATKKEERGGVSEALRPITSYPKTYAEVNREAREQMAHGVQQLTAPTGGDLWESAKAATKGVANIAGGAIGYGLSPVTAGIRTSLSRPVEELTGIPKGYTEFGTELALPGIGFTRAPRIPFVTRTPAKGPEAEAGRLLEHQIGKEGGDPEAVRRALETPAEEIVPGSKPTTFQQTGDLGAGQVERGATTRHPAAFQERFGEQNAARLEAMEKIQTAGSPEEVATHLRTALQRDTAQADEGVKLAQQRAWEASQQVGGTYDPTTYGNIFRQELRVAEDAARANERELWGRVDPNGTLQSNPQRVQEVERGIYGNMTEAGAASITPAERQLTELIQNYKSVIPFQELRDLRSLTSTALREELYTRGQTPAYARLSRLRGGIEEAIPRSFTQEGATAEGVGERLRAASAATRERAETFRPTRDITRREGAQGPYRMGEASVPGRIVQSGARGYDSASSYLRAVGNERGLADLQDAVAASARREVIGPDGSINPRKLEGWLKRYQDTLRAIDERDGGAFSQRLRNLGTAQDTLDTAIARQTQVGKQTGKDELRNIIGAVDDADVTRMIANILGRHDAVGRMRELVSRLSGNDAALQGARRAVVEHLRTRLLSNMEAAASGKPIIKAEQFQNFVKHNEPALRQLMAPEQVETLKNIARDIQQRSNRTVQTGIRGRSTTAQDIEGLRRQEESALKAGAKQVGKVAGKGLIDTIAAHIPIIGPLSVRAGEAVLGGQMAKWKAKGINTIQELVDEAMLNPEVARELLSRTHTTQIKRGIRSPFQAGGGVPAIGGTGGRSLGATTPAGARAARQGASQALQDGGAAGDQQAGQGYAEGGEVAAQPQAQPGLRERWGALQTGTTAGGAQLTGGGGGGKPGKSPVGLLRKDIVDTLKRHGINDKEVLSGWAESDPTVDSRAEGGAVDGDEPQYFMPPDGAGRWPIAQTSPTEGRSVGDEMRVQTEAAQSGDAAIRGLFESGRLRMNPHGWDSWLANAPLTTHIQDRTRDPKSTVYDTSKGEPSEDLSDSTLARELGYGEAGQHVHRVPLPRPRLRPHTHAEGGPVEDEDKLPLPGQSRGLSSTAGPTVTSTMREEDIPAPRTNKAGETFPTALLKHWGQGLVSLPERATHAAGELQRQGDVYDPGPALETAGWMLGARTPFMKQGDLGIFGGRGAKTANLDMLKRAEEMHASGAAPESIWNQTGWALGPEGKWRYEIPDQAAIVKPTERIYAPAYHVPAASRPSGYRAGTLEEVIHHPEFFEAYPQFKDMPASMELGEGINKGGGYLPPAHIGLPGDVGSIQARAPHTEGAREVLLHEMQHGVQEAEGFGPGANPNQLPYTPRQMTELTKQYADLKGVDWKTLTPEQRKAAEKQVRYDMYRMYAGETEARNVQARADFENRQTPPWKTEDVPREFQLVPRDAQAAAGIPVKGRKPYMLEERPEGVRAPGIVRSEFDRPLFDYSNMAERPNVPQFGLPRIIPARGIPEHILRLGDPRNMERTNAIVQMGMSHGGPEWYNTMPLRERYIGEVGATKGPESHRSYINYVGATSPRSPVPLNASVASYYDMLAAQGRPFPEPVFRGGNWSMPRGQLPEGYGSLAQATNARNAQMIREQGGWPSWTHFDKPKPPSFTSNLLGNYWPVTSDVHNVSMLDLRGPRGNRLIMPPHPYYGHIEQLQQGPKGAGQFIDLAPAQYQASGWIPWAAGYRNVGRYGDVTGGSPKKLEAYSQPFIRVVEDRVKNKARELGWSPEQTLRAFLRKEIAIVGVPAAAIPLLQDHLQQADQGGS